ncbi:MAG TPA: MBL fold metallo-hydrolase [Ilumatobacteraceae bacterium]|nr:MBL fold metallo-hydrolase [Ilumatobacteraceae bacterium]
MRGPPAASAERTDADPPLTPRPAATVVLVRAGAAGPEVLLTRRPPSMAFAGDMYVFPGGRVDPADADPAILARTTVRPGDASDALGGDLPGEAALAAYVAAIRESFEEAGVLLADGGTPEERARARTSLLRGETTFAAIATDLDLRLRADRLVPLSRWVTPRGLPRRFDTRFFVAALPDDAVVTYEGGEVVADTWLRPRDALEAMAAGELGMWLPTSTTLQQLAHVDTVDDVRDRLAPGRLREVVVEDRAPGVVRIAMPAGGGVAGQPVHSYLVGRSSCVLVDPGDPTSDGQDRAMAEAARRGGSIVAIALSHSSPDHAAGAEAIAERLGIDVHIGPGGGRYLPYPTVELADGAMLDAGDVVMRVVATPGPTADHLAFVVDAGDGPRALCGDLDGRRGARSIPGPVDEVAWRASRARLGSLVPETRWLGGHPG